METVLKTTNLTKIYGGRPAVDNVDLCVKRGEVYGFLGKNGAGKTTTIRMILGLIRPDGGTVELFGKNLKSHAREALLRTGSLVESAGFYENLTAHENLAIMARLHGLQGRKSLIETSLKDAGLEPSDRKTARHFSMGMKQRLGIAIALLHRPDLLILDEPTNGLDPVGIKETRGLILGLASEKGITVFVSSHILSEVEQMADRIGIIHEGRLLEEIGMQELRRRNRKYLLIRVSSDSKASWILEHRLKIVDYEIRPEGELRIFSGFDRSAAINRAFHDEGVEVSELRASEDDLEDYFIKLTGGAL